MGLGVGGMQKWRNDMGREVIHEGFQGLLPDTTKRWLIFRNLPETAGPAAQTPPSLHAGGQDDASREQIPPNDTGPLNPRFIKCACVALHAPPPIACLAQQLCRQHSAPMEGLDLAAAYDGPASGAPSRRRDVIDEGGSRWLWHQLEQAQIVGDSCSCHN